MSPPSPQNRVAKPYEKSRSGGRTQLEDRERAFIAASRRSDRSAEARLESARKASEVHFQRTGRALKITPQIVEEGEQYEEVDDDMSRRIRVFTRTRDSALGDRTSNYMAMGISRMVDDAELRRREQAVECEFRRVFPQLGQQQPQQQHAVSFPQPFEVAQRLGARALDQPNSSQSPLAPHRLSSVRQSPSPVQYTLDGWKDTRRQSAPSAHLSLEGEQLSVYPGSPLGFGRSVSPPGSQRPPDRSASLGTPLFDQHTPDLTWNSSSGAPSMTSSSGGSPLDPSLRPVISSGLPSSIKDLMSADGVGMDMSDFSVGGLDTAGFDGIEGMRITSEDLFAADSAAHAIQDDKSLSTSAYMFGIQSTSGPGTHRQQPGVPQMPVYWPREVNAPRSPRDMENEVHFEEFVHTEES